MYWAKNGHNMDYRFIIGLLVKIRFPQAQEN
jgi:hypothetical protein